MSTVPTITQPEVANYLRRACAMRRITENKAVEVITQEGGTERILADILGFLLVGYLNSVESALYWMNEIRASPRFERVTTSSDSMPIVRLLAQSTGIEEHIIVEMFSLYYYQRLSLETIIALLERGDVKKPLKGGGG